MRDALQYAHREYRVCARRDAARARAGTRWTLEPSAPVAPREVTGERRAIVGELDDARTGWARCGSINLTPRAIVRSFPKFVTRRLGLERAPEIPGRRPRGAEPRAVGPRRAIRWGDDDAPVTVLEAVQLLEREGYTTANKVPPTASIRCGARVGASTRSRTHSSTVGSRGRATSTTKRSCWGCGVYRDASPRYLRARSERRAGRKLQQLQRLDARFRSEE